MLFMSFLCSCMPDNCRNNNCQNGGVCVAGSCSCLNGYEGEHCSEVWNQRFTGGWNAIREMRGTDARYTYSLVIADSGNAGEFWITKLDDNIDGAVCRRKSYREFYFMPLQQIDSGITLISGSGAMDSTGKMITASYVLETQDTVFSYQLRLEKQ